MENALIIASASHLQQQNYTSAGLGSRAALIVLEKDFEVRTAERHSQSKLRKSSMLYRLLDRVPEQALRTVGVFVKLLLLRPARASICLESGML